MLIIKYKVSLKEFLVQVELDSLWSWLTKLIQFNSEGVRNGERGLWRREAGPKGVEGD